MSAARWIWVSAVGLAVFVAVVATQGVLAPGFRPAEQMVSEYAHGSHGSHGSLLTVGFLAWSASLAALAYLTVAAVGGWRRGGRLARTQAVCLALAAVSVLLLACFATDRGAEVPAVVTRATDAGRLHDAASALASVALLLAALIGAWRCTGLARALTVLLLLAGLVTVIALAATGDPVPGVRQRALLATACLWQCVWLWDLGGRFRATSPRSSAGSRCSTS